MLPDIEATGGAGDAAVQLHPRHQAPDRHVHAALKLMRLQFSDEDEAFRAELLEWLERNPPPSPEEEAADPSRSSADQRPWAVRWQRTLFDAGYLVPGWPPELGGRNATPVQQMIYFEELTRRKIRRTRNPQGLSIITPSILDHGTHGRRSGSRCRRCGPRSAGASA